ncbi:MAG: rRNA maturation RNase YbeY [Gammaproteobacteria bacterium]|nr:rRNA maturation RNase YbeY [Gammaproteobacteria bacterium]MDH3848018.1 rRNA maturation RNase YbeY [Gammaproteobacteria bacterium]MDH3863354.1 rRNA maturation RNase YbeY [Gammaproteobacteria bacterium]MDH3906177.1 rRNA maturation RNase YbeY [Gammaproteobacteria bacterium]MDH3908948.1 rRNA maturation RNase YbeY [Gammaproteobacteria bacterium]
MNVDVQIAADAAGIPASDSIRDWVQRAVNETAPGRDVDVSVRIVDEHEMRALNRDYRDQDQPTNVLAFPAGDAGFVPPGERLLLGDIVVCATVVAGEAEEQGKPLDHHWGHMLVHGTLHLLGHDHATDRDAEVMETLERRVLASLGIADPYAGN